MRDQTLMNCYRSLLHLFPVGFRQKVCLLCMSWDSSVSIVTSLQVDSKLGQKFSSSQYHTDWLQGMKQLRCEADSSHVVKMKLSLFLIKHSAMKMYREVEVHTSLHQGNSPQYWVEGWVDLRASLDTTETRNVSAAMRNQIPVSWLSSLVSSLY